MSRPKMGAMILAYRMGVTYQTANVRGQKGLRALMYGAHNTPAELRAFDLGRSRSARGLGAA